MRGLDNLRTRLNYQGGVTAESRFQRDKEKSLKKALLYSYQAETAILSDGREFRCLINTDKTKADYDRKIISIPYADVCLGRIDENGNEIKQRPYGTTTQGIEKIGMKCGDVFKWKETDSYWLVYLESIEEDAYFRAEIYKCEEEIMVNGKKYYVYVRGPVETTIRWNQKKTMSWNDLNYSLIIYITKDENTLDFFHRFKHIKIGNKNWEVATVDPYSADGIIEVCLNEYFENTLEEHYNEVQAEREKEPERPTSLEKYIEGPRKVSPFDKYQYTIYGMSEGKWEIDNPKKAVIKKEKDSTILVEIVTGKSGHITLSYKTEDDEVTLPIEITSI